MITASEREVFPGDSPHYVGHYPTLEDIAQGLGRIARFAGQTARFYTVLPHVIVGDKLVDPKHRIHWLLHDAPEAVVSDVPTTWKSFEAEVNELELLVGIRRVLGVDEPSPEALAEVKRVDAICLAAEAHALGHAQADRWWPKDQWTTDHALAYERTMMLLQSQAPIAFLDPATAVHAYVPKVREALEETS